MTQPRLVGNRYELGELIGYGGMAEVHRGRDIRLGRDVAIKVLRPDLARDPSFLNRFRREAQSAAGLNHPAIVAVYDTGEDPAPDGSTVPFIVMEYVEGRTLRDILKADGPLPPRRALEITADVAGALDFSHRNGLIHRDVKPANVMITHAGAVKVMDFGIARALADNSATVTQTAAVIGTAQYLSPEQARGEAVDARSDVYSTGCLLYELLTGQPPFRGDSPVAVAYQHVRENAAAPSTVNPALTPAIDSIVMKALAKNPLNRYQSAAEMREDLLRAIAARPVQAESVLTDAERTQYIARSNAVPPRPRPIVPLNDEYDESRGSRGGWIWVAVVVALLLVIGVAAYAIVAAGSDKTKLVSVPALVGQNKSTAEQTIRAAGFVVGTESTSSGPCGDPPPSTGGAGTVGNVCTQSPSSSTQQPKGTTINITTYVVGTKSVPQCTGESSAECVAALTAVGLKATLQSVDNPAAAGTVLSTNPAAYSTVAPGSTVVVMVADGKIAVASQIGKAAAAAQNALNGLDFANVVIVQVPTTDPALDNKVIAQNPSSGSYPPSQQITLSVGNYTPPAPTCTTVPPSSSNSPDVGSSGTGTATGSPSDTASPSTTATSTSTSTGDLPPC